MPTFQQLYAANPVTLTGEEYIAVQQPNGNYGSANSAAMMPYPAFKNLLIGGDFTTNPWQRGTTFTGVATGSYTADRFRLDFATIGSGAFNIAQTADAPTVAQSGNGATQSLRFTVGTAATGAGAGTYCNILQPIEAFNFGAIGFGASSANSVTLSVWVKSSVNAVYSAYLQNAAQNRSNPTNFTINSANTWEKKTITFTGDTTGTWSAGTTMASALLGICLHAGSTYQGTNATWAASNYSGTSSNTNTLITTLNATFQIALVQHEAGSSATTFEALPEDVVLGRCQRYFETSYPAGFAPGTSGYQSVSQWTGIATMASGDKFSSVSFRVQKRTTPTVTTYSYTGTTNKASNLAGTDVAAGSCTPNVAYTSGFFSYNASGGTITPANGGFAYNWTASAEL